MFVLHHICADGWAHSLLICGTRRAVHGRRGRHRAHTRRALGPAHGLRPPPAGGEGPGTEAPAGRALRRLSGGGAVPARRPRRTVPGPRSSAVTAARCAAWASGELRTALEKFAADRHVTPFAVTVAALGIHLARLSGERDVLLSVPYANREDLDCGVAGGDGLPRPSWSGCGSTRPRAVAELVSRTGAERPRRHGERAAHRAHPAGDARRGRDRGPRPGAERPRLPELRRLRHRDPRPRRRGGGRGPAGRPRGTRLRPLAAS